MKKLLLFAFCCMMASCCGNSNSNQPIVDPTDTIEVSYIDTICFEQPDINLL